MLYDPRIAARQHADRFGVDPELFLRIVQKESAWNPKAVSPVGARGFTQVMPDTGRDPGFGVTPLRENDDDDNLRFGAEYFSAMMNRYDGDTNRALAAYNWGAGNADK